MNTVTSIRLDKKIKGQLDFFATKEKRAKNWIINQALKEFLEKNSFNFIIAKARKECLLINKQDKKNKEFTKEWETLGIDSWDE